MGAPSSQQTSAEVLHLIRIRGVLSASSPEARGVAETLRALEEDGCVLRGEFGAMLTEHGHERHAEQVAEERRRIDLDALAAAYERFLAVNQPVKRVCSHWLALVDPDEQFIALDELARLHERGAPALTRAGRVLTRFEAYETRLAAALQQATDGDSRYVCDPTVDAYHSIWFECHEDFLVTLDRSREEEGSW